MIYNDDIKMDDNLKLIECPRCKNTEFSENSDYCRICGLPLYNKCGYYDSDGYYNGAGHLNPSNARYCETCGERTTFLSLGVLKPYNDYLKDLNKNSEKNLDLDLDIPF